jgi:hypothetical protein
MVSLPIGLAVRKLIDNSALLEITDDRAEALTPLPGKAVDGFIADTIGDYWIFPPGGFHEHFHDIYHAHFHVQPLYQRSWLKQRGGNYAVNPSEPD